MRILITGGFGFVGGRLAQHLEAVGHQIVLGTRKPCQRPGWITNVEVVQIKWEDNTSLYQSCSRVDVVIQAAGMNAENCAADPPAALAFNGLATSRLVSAAIRAGVKRFIYLSTAHVYASPLVGTISEDVCPRNVHPYATSHLAGEYAVKYAVQKKQIEGYVLRISNSVGAPAHRDVNCWMLLVNDLCRQATLLRSMTLRSSGRQQLDFITLHDVAQVIAHMVCLSKDHLGEGIFNVGSGQSMQVIDMVKKIQARCLHLLGFVPEIILSRPADNEQSNDFDYKIDKLLSTKFSFSGDFTKEIDNTLMMCGKFFT